MSGSRYPSRFLIGGFAIGAVVAGVVAFFMGYTDGWAFRGAHPAEARFRMDGGERRYVDIDLHEGRRIVLERGEDNVYRRMDGVKVEGKTEKGKAR